MMSDIRPIRTDEDHARAIAEIAAFEDAVYEPGTPASDRLDVLVTLVKAYEAKHASVPDADPIGVLHFAIEDMGRSQGELADLLGSTSRASEILNRRRPLTLDMIRAISEAWKIPRDALTDAYALTPTSQGMRGGGKRRRTPDATAA